MLVTSVLFVLVAVGSALQSVEQLYTISNARSSACQAYDGSNNWGVFFDNYARQDVLWSQDADSLRQWDVSPATRESTCSRPPLIGQFDTPAGMCPYLNTQYSRSLFRSTNVPTVCTNCTPTAVDVCDYELQVTDARCGSPYKIAITQSPAWPIGRRLGDGQQVSGPGRIAIDTDLTRGSTSSDACSPLANAAEMASHWCVVTLGSCSVDTKVRNCFGGDTSNPHGILGVIVIDSAASSAAPSSGAVLAPITFSLQVPLIMISRLEGDRLAGSVTSTLFTLSKAIGPASYQSFPRAGILTREERTGAIFDSVTAARPAAYRFFFEPNRLLAWAFGMQAPDGTTTNVGLFDLANTDAPSLIQRWTYAQVGLSASFDWSPSNLIFGQRVGSRYFWIVGSETEFRFWDVTNATGPRFLSSSIARKGGAAFIDRSATHLWQQVPPTASEPVQEWRYQEAWNISDLESPRLLGAFALDTSLYTLSRGSQIAMRYPTFDSWGSQVVSFNLGDNGVAFYNYSDPINVTLVAHRDTSPSSCAPPGVGGPSGAIVPGPEPHVWFACRQWEPVPLWRCGQGRVNRPNATQCDSATFSAAARFDFVAYRLQPEAERKVDQCEDGAIVNMFFERRN